VPRDLRHQLERSGYSRQGFAARYDQFRPRPPAALLELLPPLTGRERLRLVVDLGSGTGLSTRFWSESAEEVVGVEPQEAMRRYAEEATEAPNVRYIQASSDATGLPVACADLLTAAQSLHWMEPEPTFAEIARILRPGGVFCAYQYFVLQTPSWELESAWGELLARKGRLREERGLDPSAGQWTVTRERLEESGSFRDVRELAAHSVEEGDGERLVGLALSEGSLQTLLEAGASEEDVGLDRLRQVAATVREPIPWWIGYRVWLGLR
jgi:SAM-dependent methyltransferase